MYIQALQKLTGGRSYTVGTVKVYAWVNYGRRSYSINGTIVTEAQAVAALEAAKAEIDAQWSNWELTTPYKFGAR